MAAIQFVAGGDATAILPAFRLVVESRSNEAVDNVWVEALRHGDLVAETASVLSIWIIEKCSGSLASLDVADTTGVAVSEDSVRLRIEQTCMHPERLSLPFSRSTGHSLAEVVTSLTLDASVASTAQQLQGFAWEKLVVVATLVAAGCQLPLRCARERATISSSHSGLDTSPLLGYLESRAIGQSLSKFLSRPPMFSNEEGELSLLNQFDSILQLRKQAELLRARVQLNQSRFGTVLATYGKLLERHPDFQRPDPTLVYTDDSSSDEESSSEDDETCSSDSGVSGVGEPQHSGRSLEHKKPAEAEGTGLFDNASGGDHAMPVSQPSNGSDTDDSLSSKAPNGNIFATSASDSGGLSSNVQSHKLASDGCATRGIKSKIDTETATSDLDFATSTDANDYSTSTYRGGVSAKQQLIAIGGKRKLSLALEEDNNNSTDAAENQVNDRSLTWFQRRKQQLATFFSRRKPKVKSIKSPTLGSSTSPEKPIPEADTSKLEEGNENKFQVKGATSLANPDIVPGPQMETQDVATGVDKSEKIQVPSSQELKSAIETIKESSDITEPFQGSCEDQGGTTDSGEVPAKPVVNTEVSAKPVVSDQETKTSQEISEATRSQSVLDPANEVLHEKRTVEGSSVETTHFQHDMADGSLEMENPQSEISSATKNEAAIHGSLNLNSNTILKSDSKSTHDESASNSTLADHHHEAQSNYTINDSAEKHIENDTSIQNQVEVPNVTSTQNHVEIPKQQVHTETRRTTLLQDESNNNDEREDTESSESSSSADSVVESDNIGKQTTHEHNPNAEKSRLSRNVSDVEEEDL